MLGRAPAAHVGSGSASCTTATDTAAEGARRALRLRTHRLRARRLRARRLRARRLRARRPRDVCAFVVYSIVVGDPPRSCWDEDMTAWAPAAPSKWRATLRWVDEIFDKNVAVGGVWAMLACLLLPRSPQMLVDLFVSGAGDREDSVWAGKVGAVVLNTRRVMPLLASTSGPAPAAPSTPAPASPMAPLRRRTIPLTVVVAALAVSFYKRGSR